MTFVAKGGASAHPRRAGLDVQTILKAVADARLGDQEPRLVWVGLDLLTQLSHEDPKVLNVVALVAAPDLLEKLVVGDDKADMQGENI